MDIWKVFKADETLIKEYKYWKLLLHLKQNKLGRMVAILKREAFPLSKINPEEMSEYSEVVKDAEGALEKSFGAYLVQHLCLMFKDKQVHFHIIPRYEEEIEFAGETWVDSGEADPLVQEVDEIEAEPMDLIIKEIKKNLE
ncbi:MAG TPA: hypothetical protein ENI23_01430 [bacterium]|nr:hypothetical protein [bacterium]